MGVKGRLERSVDCPVAGRKVRVLEYQETCQPTASCCLSSRLVMSLCDEEQGCSKGSEGHRCPLLEEPGLGCAAPR